MVGRTGLTVAKAILTRHCRKLKLLAEECEAEKESLSNGEQDEIRAKAMELEEMIKLTSTSLSKFAEAVDSMNEVTEEQDQDIQDYLEKAQAVIDQAETITIQLEALRKTLERRNARMSHIAAPNTSMGYVEATRLALPAIPVPTFTGELEEFENFWRLFEANVDKQPLNKLQKFNYLINSLQGNARELIRRYIVSEENYDEAVAMLQRTYGDRTRLINMLQHRLEQVCAADTRMESQRRLLESIIPLVSQLEAHGVYLNGSYASQKLLSKFNIEIQRKVLQHHLTPGMLEEEWQMKGTIAALDECLSMEERIHEMIAFSSGEKAVFNLEKTRMVPTREDDWTTACMFCNATDHRTATCTRFRSVSERRRFFQDSKRCLNCGKIGHFVKYCRSAGCKVCSGQKHHHALCPKRNDIREGAFPTQTRTRTSTNNSQAIPQRQMKERVSKSTKDKDANQTHIVKANKSRDVKLPVQDDCESIAHSEEFANQKKADRVLLLTGTAKVWNNCEGKWIEIKILFDTGADQSFIDSNLAQRIGITCTQRQQLQMYTFGSAEPKCAEYGLAHVKVSDIEGKQHKLHLFITPVVTGKGSKTSLCAQDKAFLRENRITLSKTSQTGDFDPEILLGCDQLWTFLEGLSPQYQLPSGLLLIPSKFGYLLTGKQQRPMDVSERTLGVSNTSVAMVQGIANFEAVFEDDRDRWDKYWTMDSAGICEFTGTKDAEKEATNAKVVKFFEDTVQRRNGVYYVRLPFKEDHTQLPDNRAIAKKRLEGILRRLKADSELFQAYDKTIQDQLKKGIIEKISNDEPVSGEHVHYIPHQPVITPHKETTKLRIVFDASSHFKDRPSLNDVLYQGPLILPEIYAMLLRFRMAPYVATSDVEKAFLQVRLHELDRDATRFLWIRNINLPVEESNIITFRFARVTFGLNVSPFLLAGTISYHLEHHTPDQQLAKEIRKNLYVDNLILTAQTEENLNEKAIKARMVFADMGMNLREFLSNTDSLQKTLPEESCACSKLQKVLGLHWDAEQDLITIKCSIPAEETLTKRLVARYIASVYDPLGLLVPLMVKLKVFQQDLWKRELQWDEEIKGSLKERWSLLREETDGFQKSLIRMAINNAEEYSLAIFADASDMAIAACGYLFNEGSATIIIAKSKLPSIKTRTTIPKLELNALTIATRLAFSVYEAVKTENSFPKKIHIFSDSQIALSWISSHSQRADLGVLVKNRIKEIHKIVENLKKSKITVQFHHVASEQNPADVGSRGTKASEFKEHIWWSGPSFLQLPETQWPTILYTLREGTQQEKEDPMTVLKVKVGSYLEQDLPIPLLDLTRFSSLTFAKRTAAIVLIFIRRLMHKLSRERQNEIFMKIKQLKDVQDSPVPITGTTVQAARITIIQDHQRCHISSDYRKSMDNSLRLFQDTYSIWRSRGRLGKSSLNSSMQTPIFIAPKTALANLIISEAHGLYHRGVEHTMMTVRTQYWIPQLRQQVRHFAQRCVNCRRFNALPYHYPETCDLPQRRVQRSRPFQHVGLDFFDLPTIHEGNEELKQYGCIFTCAVTRMIHLELVYTMSTEDFLNALRRFIARRGVPESITCDNAPTFLLSATILEEGHLDSYLPAKVAYATSNMEIKWYHITPYAPWQGAFYERLIKSIKQSLHKAIKGTTVRSRDHLHTILTEIEACLNSRPLTYQSSSQEELTAIRPIDFYQKNLEVTFPLRGKAKTTEDTTYLPPEEARTLRTRREAEEAIQSSCRITEQFWKVWQHHYLTSLREKQLKNISRKRLGQETPTVGSVVLISDPVLPRNSWKLARITDIRRGTDGVIREAELVTSNRRKVRRPVNLLVPLEIIDDMSETTDKEPSSSLNEYSKEERLEKPYNLRPRQMSCNVENVVTTTRKRNLRNSRTKWFLFYIMVLIFTTLV